MDSKTYGMLVVMTDLYNEAAGTDIKIRQAVGGGFFALKDERTYNRICYYRFPHLEATELTLDPVLFDKVMRELILQANVECDHYKIAEQEDDDRNPRYFCYECNTEMIYNEDHFEVRTSF